jgi:hypothetical protein
MSRKTVRPGRKSTIQPGQHRYKVSFIIGPAVVSNFRKLYYGNSPFIVTTLDGETKRSMLKAKAAILIEDQRRADATELQ